jgi:hypothetical protein
MLWMCGGNGEKKQEEEEEDVIEGVSILKNVIPIPSVESTQEPRKTIFSNKHDTWNPEKLERQNAFMLFSSPTSEELNVNRWGTETPPPEFLTENRTV